MKKLISVLLAVLMVLSISVCAFAADAEEETKQSPTQDTGSYVPAVVPVAPAAAADDNADDNAADDAAVADAEASEAEAVEGVEAVSAEGEDAQGEEGREAEGAEGKEDAEATLWLGKKDGEGSDKMAEDWEALVDVLVDAKASLVADEAAAIPASMAVEGKTLSAGQPFRAVASEYPLTVTVKVPDADSFVGVMAFANGKWSALDVTVNDDGTVTFVLTQPSVLSIVSGVEEAP